MTDLFQYTACGLDYVYLSNGYEVLDTPHGRGVAVHDGDRLHETIARVIIGAHNRLCVQEVRFLRARRDLSQTELGRALGVTRGAVAKWEARVHHVTPGAADWALRLFYGLTSGGAALANRSADLLTEIDAATPGRTTFPRDRSGLDRRRGPIPDWPDLVYRP